MDIPKVRLGRTELYVTKTSFGALPVQRIGHEAARKLLRRAYESGINYFDTANMYTDSEEKIGEALHDVRHHLVLAVDAGRDGLLPVIGLVIVIFVGGAIGDLGNVGLAARHLNAQLHVHLYHQKLLIALQRYLLQRGQLNGAERLAGSGAFVIFCRLLRLGSPGAV